MCFVWVGELGGGQLLWAGSLSFTKTYRRTKSPENSHFIFLRLLALSLPDQGGETQQDMWQHILLLLNEDSKNVFRFAEQTYVTCAFVLNKMSEIDAKPVKMSGLNT